MALWPSASATVTASPSAFSVGDGWSWDLGCNRSATTGAEVELTSDLLAAVGGARATTG